MLSPHVYGHGNHPYFSAPDFPNNMPSIWWTHWARIPSLTGHAVLMGEWGGLWEAHEWGGYLRPSTKVWQQTLLDYMREQNVGHFYWTLNDNSFSTGSLFNDYTGHSAEKLQMLSLSPTTLNAELEAEWARILVTPIAPPVPSLPPAVPPVASPPPANCVDTYANCLSSRCCVAVTDSCFKRPTREYAQCRATSSTVCGGDAEWLCPGWWVA